MRARLLARTGRFAFHMLRHLCRCHSTPVLTMSSSSPTWESLREVAVVLTAQIKEAKARTRAREKVRVGGSASKAQARREATFYDYVGQSGWSQGYPFTWYWDQQHGWFWHVLALERAAELSP